MSWGSRAGNLEETLLTRKVNGLSKKKEILRRDNRPAMIISSTSWTADEDFGILLHALELLDKRTSHLSLADFPNVLVVVTGKGPQKEMYLERIKQLAFMRIRIATMYVSVWLVHGLMSLNSMVLMTAGWRALMQPGGWKRATIRSFSEALIWACACTPRPLGWICR